MDVRASYHDLVRRDVFSLLPDRIGAVLDFGGGIGATSAELRTAGRATHAVLFDQVGDQALSVVDKVEALDLDDLDAVRSALERTGPFDTILALDILEHLKDPWETVRLLDGALNPGGSLIVSVPNVSTSSVVFPLLFRGRFEYQDAGVLDRTHLRWFTRESAVALATSSGLRCEMVEPNISRRRAKWFNKLTFRAFERFAAVQYKIRARKIA